MALQGLYKCFSQWGKTGGAYIISDVHFGEDDLKYAYPHRPDDKTLIKQINQKVGKTGTLILLGDCGDIECVRQLKGYKILICGNHDVGHTLYEDVFDEVYAGPLMIGEKIILSHEPIPNLTWALNVHGHCHDPRHKNDVNHFNVCADVINYEPINFNQLLKSGILSKVETLHRTTIDNATKKARKRNKK